MSFINKDFKDRIDKDVRNTKRGIAVVLAGLVLVGSIAGCTIKRALSKKADETTSNPDINTEAYAETSSDLLLAADFDIDDDAAVRKRAEAIYQISEKKSSVEDIMNAIYILHVKGDKIIFKDGLSEDEKYKYVHSFFEYFGDLLLINDNDEERRLIAFKNGDNETVLYDETPIYSYMFLSKASEAKTMALELAELSNNQLKAVTEGGSSSTLESNAEAAYDFYFKVLDKKFSSQETYALLADLRSKAGLFAPYLSEEKAKTVNLVGNVNLDSDVVKVEIMKAVGIRKGLEKILENGSKEGSLARPLTPLGDFKDGAGKAYEKSETYSETEVVKKGGQKVTSGGSQVTVKPNKPATTSKSEHVANVTTGTHSEVVEEGGKVVEEGPTVTVPSTTKPTVPSTTKPNYVDDDETMPVYTPDEYEELIGNAKTLR